MDFLRHITLGMITKKERTTFDSTFRPFQSVELSLQELLPSRALVRFAQLNKIINFILTQFIEQTLLKQFCNYPLPCV